MTTATRKPTQRVQAKEQVEAPEEKSEQSILDYPFEQRWLALGRMIREKAGCLKFDSTIDNIDYTYVDTQQYKEYVGACCDACGIGFTISILDHNLQVQEFKNALTFVEDILLRAEFSDYKSDSTKSIESIGLGVSKGGGYAGSIAMTNAMRNMIVNGFNLPTSDRDDDVRNNAGIGDTSKYYTEAQKAEKKQELVNSTKSTRENATLIFGKTILKRANEVLETHPDIPDEFKENVEKFIAKNYLDGEPIPMDGDEGASYWIVSKKGAAKMLGDLDTYGK